MMNVYEMGDQADPDMPSDGEELRRILKLETRP
jgi:hypothetical protein